MRQGIYNIDRLGLCHPLRENFAIENVARVPEDGAGGGIVRFSGFPRSHTHTRTRTYAFVYNVRAGVYMCAVRGDATCRIASTTHFVTGAISRARRPP